MSDTTPRQNKVLVTGASRGLGRGIAETLAARGCSVAINYARNREAAEETATRCRALAPSSTQRFVPVQADVALREDRERLVEQAFEELGGLTALVNNAGIAPRVRADIVEAGEESFEELMRSNLQGPYFLTQAVVRRWLAEPDSETRRDIVFVTSISTYTASPSRGEYCVAKAGLSMARALWAARLAENGIGVYEVRPGIMATDMTSGVKQKYDALIEQGLVPQKRWGTPQDVGRAVAALLAGEFAYSTGAIIDVDGGFSLRTL
ncbi:MAG: 3-ketoacyl-ACP reductase [Armatimonadia bacterium]|nr:3-ketoacyl-ACP reductase [Armatimonadia bacterium]